MQSLWPRPWIDCCKIRVMREQMGVNARELVMNQFSFEGNAAAYVELYQAMVKFHRFLLCLQSTNHKRCEKRAK